MDKKIANNIILGVFVGLGVLGFTFLIFNMGGGKGLLAGQYTLYSKFPDVKGLHFGSEISLSGLRIGTVREISVPSEGAAELMIEMSIDKKYQRSIREDSVATIKTQGVLGDKYIEISIGSQQVKMLEDGAFIQAEQVKDLFSRSGTLVEGISDQFKKGGNVDSLMANLNTLAVNLNSVVVDIRKKQGILGAMIYGDGGKDVKLAVSHLQGIMKKIDTGKGTIGAFINDPTIYEDLKYLLGGAKRSTVLKYFLRQFVESGQEGATPGKK